MLDISKLATGYFADTKGGSEVHVVDTTTNKTICKRTFKVRKFQWCSHGITFSYIECEHCKKLAREHYDSLKPKPKTPKINKLFNVCEAVKKLKNEKGAIIDQLSPKAVKSIEIAIIQSVRSEMEKNVRN